MIVINRDQNCVKRPATSFGGNFRRAGTHPAHNPHLSSYVPTLSSGVSHAQY